MRKIFVLPCLLLLLGGCGNNDTVKEEKQPEKPTVQTTPAPLPADAPAAPKAAAAAWKGVAEISDAVFAQKVINNPGVTIVDFNATWCGPCKLLKPVFDKAAEDFAGKASFASIDVDQNPAVSEQYKVQSIPLLLFFKNGKVVHQIIGLTSKKELYAAVEKAML
jgi:thioredoxin 1